MHGDPVTLELTTTDAHTAAVSFIIKDGNGNTRTLLATERLMIDSMQVNMAAAVLGADVYAVADATATGDVIVGSFGPGSPNRVAFPHDGLSLPNGKTPLIVAQVAGAITAVGSGRIIVGSQVITRQPYRETLNP